VKEQKKELHVNAHKIERLEKADAVCVCTSLGRALYVTRV
jgi:hypothetical protein